MTRTGTGIFAPRDNVIEEEEAPRGLSLSVGSIASDGTITLDLRNYSLVPFVFAGSQNRPRLVIETLSGTTRSRSTIQPSIRRRTADVPPGERIQVTTNIGGISGRVRIGIQSHEFGYVVWTSWIVR